MPYGKGTYGSKVGRPPKKKKKKTKDKTILYSSYSLENGEYVDGNEGTLQLILNKCVLEVKELTL